MSKAFVLLNSETGLEKEVFEKINAFSSVKEIFSLYGVYDIIILVEEQDMNQLKETIFHRIRLIKGVKATLTLIVM